jgi:hypothetical protein
VTDGFSPSGRTVARSESNVKMSMHKHAWLCSKKSTLDKGSWPELGHLDVKLMSALKGSAVSAIAPRRIGRRKERHDGFPCGAFDGVPRVLQLHRAAPGQLLAFAGGGATHAVPSEAASRGTEGEHLRDAFSSFHPVTFCPGP